MISHRALRLVACLVVPSGCVVTGDVVAGPDGAGPLTAEVVSGGTPSDTAGARIGEPLVARVVDADGRAMLSREVTFEAINTLPGVFVRETLDGPDLSVLVARTDESGQVSAYVTLREVAGQGILDVRPTGFLATPVRVSVEILPANPVAIELLLGAETADVGERVAFDGEALDQYGNTVSASLSYSVTGPAQLVPGDSIVGTSAGVAWLIGEYEGVRDSTDLTIMTPARAAASDSVR